MIPPSSRHAVQTFSHPATKGSQHFSSVTVLEITSSERLVLRSHGRQFVDGGVRICLSVVVRKRPDRRGLIGGARHKSRKSGVAAAPCRHPLAVFCWPRTSQH